MPTVRLLPAGCLLLLGASAFALAAGSSALSLADVWAGLTSSASTVDWRHAVVWQLRLPRLLLAMAVGATLSQSGVVLQALFRNPLAEQSLLGVSGGAALAAAIWLVCTLPLGVTMTAWQPFALPGAALCGALLAAVLVMQLARRRSTTDIAALLLVGISINAIAGAGIVLLQTLASDSALRDLTHWFYGSLGRAGWPELGLALPLLFGIALWLPREAGALDALLLGETEAMHLGIDIEPLKRRLLVMVAVASAVSVALAGIIGFIGLIVPHLLRRVIGPGHRRLLPASGLFGASLLILADTAARTAFAPLEVPVGVLTSLLGVPMFLLLLRQRSAT